MVLEREDMICWELLPLLWVLALLIRETDMRDELRDEEDG